MWIKMVRRCVHWKGLWWYCGSDAEPSGYITSDVEPWGFITSDVEPWSFITSDVEPSGYTTSEDEPSSFTINEVEPYRYITRNVEPFGYKTSGSVSSGFIRMLNLLVLLPAIWNLQLIAITNDIEPSAYTFLLGTRNQIGARPPTVQASRSHTDIHKNPVGLSERPTSPSQRLLPTKGTTNTTDEHPQLILPLLYSMKRELEVFHPEVFVQ
jgi:hypothetical protein